MPSPDVRMLKRTRGVASLSAGGGSRNKRQKRCRPLSTSSNSDASRSVSSLDFLVQNADFKMRYPEMTERLEQMLPQLPDPCPSLKIVGPVGEGTFSTVFLVKQRSPGLSQPLECVKWRRRYAIKHLVPTASPERLQMEVECLRIAGGKSNVLPLLFVYRIKGEVILGMPFIDNSKFNDVIATMDFIEMKLYMKSLLQALAHIHELGIIHRDIKPANFLYDRRRGKFGLVDFGLAQKGVAVTDHSVPTYENENAAKENKSSGPTTEQLANLSISKKEKRPILEDSTTHESSVLNKVNGGPNPPEMDEHGSPEERSLNKTVSTPKRPQTQTQRQIDEFLLRRSPRKHPSSLASCTTLDLPRQNLGYATLKISGSTILTPNQPRLPPPPSVQKDPSPQQLNSSAPRAVTFSRTNSFTILDPASGIPSDGTPRLNASLTSVNSFSTTMAGVYNNILHVPQFQQPSPFILQPPLFPCQPTSGFSSKAQVKLPGFKMKTVKPCIVDPPMDRCQCLKKPKACGKCLRKPNLKAPRAGTPGFRPPEVLLKFEGQSTAVDIWAAGMIMLSILCRSYPFFRAYDDLYTLAELSNVFGTEAMTKVAQQLGKALIFSDWREPVDLRQMCFLLSQRSRHPRSRQLAAMGLSQDQNCLVNEESADLCHKLLTLFHDDRITAANALRHPMFQD